MGAGPGRDINVPRPTPFINTSGLIPTPPLTLGVRAERGRVTRDLGRVRRRLSPETRGFSLPYPPSHTLTCKPRIFSFPDPFYNPKGFSLRIPCPATLDVPRPLSLAISLPRAEGGVHL